MRHLRNLSARPDLVVDPRARTLVDPPTGTRLGRPGPFGRARVVNALPVNGSAPVQLAAPAVLHDPDGAYIADPQGNLIGVAAVWVSRMLTARWVEDTRRIAG